MNQLTILLRSTIFVIGVTSILLAALNDLRLKIIILSIQYVGVFILVAQSWPVNLALVKVVAGWMTCAVLGITVKKNRYREKRVTRENISGIIFRFLGTVLIVLTIIAVTPTLSKWFIAVNTEQLFGGSLLIGIGLLIVGMYSSSMDVFIGLLTLLSGFEILYSAMEISVLVAGLLAAITLGIALVGAYLYILEATGDAA